MRADARLAGVALGLWLALGLSPALGAQSSGIAQASPWVTERWLCGGATASSFRQLMQPGMGIFVGYWFLLGAWPLWLGLRGLPTRVGAGVVLDFVFVVVMSVGVLWCLIGHLLAAAAAVPHWGAAVSLLAFVGGSIAGSVAAFRRLTRSRSTA